MNLGTILEFDAGDRFRIGAVTGRLGTKKLIVLTEDGDEMRPASRSVTYAFDETVDASEGPEGVVEALSAIAKRVERLEDEVELESIWSQVVDADTTHPVEELAALHAAEVGRERDDVTTLAVLRALRSDTVYFRERKRGWTPRSRDRVAESIESRRRAAERRAARRTFLEQAAVSVVDGRDAAGALDIRGPEVQRHLDILESYAATDNELGHRHEAERLLDELEDLLGYRLRGSGPLRAFWLLVELDRWSEHEDLARRRFRLLHPIPAEVETEVESLVERGWQFDGERRDFTDLWTCTIDDPESRDLDDALSVRPLSGGGWEVAVHIAEPTALVALDSPLDRHAQRFATSIYLPTGAIPMFPRELSEGVMSLVQGEPRPTLSIVFTFSDRLQVESVEIVTARIVVDRRLSYAEVDAVLHGVEVPGVPSKTLHQLRHIADEFHVRRVHAGAVEIGIPETKLNIDLGGPEPSAELRVVENSPARSLVQEFMVAANVEVATFCDRHDIPTLYRIQDPPDGDLDDDQIMAIPPGVARELARVKRMCRAEFSVVAAPHAGLGVSMYTQASSPIRRYTDLVVQRQVKARLAGEPLPYDADALLEASGMLERSLYEARAIEQEALDYWMIWLLARHQGDIEAEVIDFRDLDGDVATVFLTHYGYRATSVLRSEVGLGEHVMLEITRADPRQRALSLREARPG